MTTKKEFTRVNVPDDLEVVVPKPVPDHPGFYYFVSDNRLGINKNSEVLNLETGKIIRPSLSKTGKLYLVFHRPGERDRAYLVHRMMGFTFIGRPSRYLDKPKVDLEINHIDGNQLNNAAENLEWVTGSENVIHARDNGLKPDNHSILIRSIATGEITRCISMRQCAKDFNISKSTLYKHLKSTNTLKLHKEGYLFRYDIGEGWPANHPDEIKNFHEGNEIGCANRTYGVVTIVNTKNGEQYVSDTIATIAKAFKLSYSTLARKLRESDDFQINHYRFKVLKRN